MGVLRMKAKASSLKNAEGFMRKPDPFFELSRKIDSAGGATWYVSYVDTKRDRGFATVHSNVSPGSIVLSLNHDDRDNVYRSNVVKDNLSPSWQDVTVELSLLCGGDLDKPVLVTIYDYESDGKHVAMGKFETTVNGLLKTSEFTLTDKNRKSAGIFLVETASVAGTQSSTVEQGMQKLAVTAPAAVAATTNDVGQPTFVDYVSGGCQLNVCVAVDFTGSNGTCCTKR